MRVTLGENLVVENQPGAGGTIALNRVARADPDGHTLYLGNWSVNVGGVTMHPVNFDVLNDFEPIALLTSAKTWVVARNDLPANTAKEWVAWLKANPGKANAASVGVGSATHVCLLEMMKASGTNFQFVTYRGGAPAVQALATGEADFACLEAGQTLGPLPCRQGQGDRGRQQDALVRRTRGADADGRRRTGRARILARAVGAEVHAQAGDRQAQRRRRQSVRRSVGQAAL